MSQVEFAKKYIEIGLMSVQSQPLSILVFEIIYKNSATRYTILTFLYWPTVIWNVMYTQTHIK
jgi:hypothetical protein